MKRNCDQGAGVMKNITIVIYCCKNALLRNPDTLNVIEYTITIASYIETAVSFLSSVANVIKLFTVVSYDFS